MKYVRIPASRVGALIGPGGKTKRKLEELSGCDISIDSDEGLFEIIKGNEKDALRRNFFHNSDASARTHETLL